MFSINSIKSNFFTSEVSIKDDRGKSHGNFTAYKNIAALFMRLKGDAVKVISQDNQVFYIDRRDVKSFLKATGVDYKGLSSENGTELVSQALKTFAKPTINTPVRNVNETPIVKPRERLQVGRLSEPQAYELYLKSKTLGNDFKSRNIANSLLEFKDALKSGPLTPDRASYFQFLFSQNGTLDFIENSLKFVDKSNPNFIFSLDNSKIKQLQTTYEAKVKADPMNVHNRAVLSKLLELERIIRDGASDQNKNTFLAECEELGVLKFIGENT